MSNSSAQAQAETKQTVFPAVAVSNKTLVKLFKEFNQAEGKVKTTMADALKLLKETVWPSVDYRDEVILRSLEDKSGRGLSPESARTELSRIRGWLSDEQVDKYNAFQRGDITLTMMRKKEKTAVKADGTQKGAGRPKATATDKFTKSVEALAKLTVTELPTMTKDEFISALGNAFDKALTEKQETAKELEAGRASGAVQGPQIPGGFEVVAKQVSAEEFAAQTQPEPQPAAVS
jgi:hypothetical protein